jgi:hypothetical protein
MRLSDQSTSPTDGLDIVSACSTPEVEDPMEQEKWRHERPDFDDIMDVPHYMKPVLIRFAKRWPNESHEALALWFHKRFLKTIAVDVVQCGFSKSQFDVVISSSECWLTWRYLVAILEQNPLSDVPQKLSGRRKATGRKTQLIEVRISAHRPGAAECASEVCPTSTSDHETQRRRKTSTQASTTDRDSATQHPMTTASTASGRRGRNKVNFERRVLRSNRTSSLAASQPAQSAQSIYGSRKVEPFRDNNCHGREYGIDEVRTQLSVSDACH